jgi:hypothetical protein
MEKYKKILMGTIAGAMFLGVVATSAICTLGKENSKLEQRLQESEQKRVQQMERLDSFLQQLPNYNAESAWLDGESYQQWMIDDINRKYDRCE